MGKEDDDAPESQPIFPLLDFRPAKDSLINPDHPVRLTHFSAWLCSIYCT